MATATMAPPRRGRVDRQTGVISGCKIISTASKKNRVYPRRVLQEALTKYENAGVYCDHVDQGIRRSLKDKLGTLQNVRLQEDGLYADFHLNLGHPQAEQILFAAENDPGSLGFSHNARGPSIMRNGVQEVTRIDDVLSVDLVANPAATDGLFEDRLFESLDGSHVGFNGKLVITDATREAWLKRHRDGTALQESATPPPASTEPPAAPPPADSTESRDTFRLLPAAARATAIHEFRRRCYSR